MSESDEDDEDDEDAEEPPPSPPPPTSVRKPKPFPVPKQALKPAAPTPRGTDAFDIEKALLDAAEEEESEHQCGLCLGPGAIRQRKDTGEPFFTCLNGCKFGWMTLKEAGILHTLARHKLDPIFRPKEGGTIPRCPNHHMQATLTLVTKHCSKQTAPIKDHLFFTCNNPMKEGGPCILPKSGKWSAVADVQGSGPEFKENRRRLVQLYSLDYALYKKKQREAEESMYEAFRESEADFQHGTGFFAAGDVKTRADDDDGEGTDAEEGDSNYLTDYC